MICPQEMELDQSGRDHAPGEAWETAILNNKSCPRFPTPGDHTLQVGSDVCGIIPSGAPFVEDAATDLIGDRIFSYQKE